MHFKLCMVAIHVYIHDQDHAQCDFCKYLREIIVTFLMSADTLEFAHSQILGYILHTRYVRVCSFSDIGIYFVCYRWSTELHIFTCGLQLTGWDN